jgi:type VII secretion protein EccB
MQNKQDQLHAHTFVLGRVVSALTRGEPDAAETPMRRFSTAAVAGLLVGALLAAGFAVWGLLFPGSGTAWRTPGTLIVEGETGNRYLLIDQVLHPVANYASARLLLGPDPKVASVPAKSLGGVPHGSPVGIPGAPDALPTAARLDGREWLVCSTPAPSTSTDGAAAVQDDIAIGAGARTTAGAAADSALLARTPDGTMYLAWHGRRLRLGGRAALVALGYGTAEPWPASSLWAAVLPQGDDLAAPDIPHRGDPGPRIGSTETRIGQVLEVRTDNTASAAGHFLVLSDGLAPLSATETALILGDPKSRDAYPAGSVAAIRVAASDAAALPSSTRKAPSDLPPAPPALTQPLQDRPQDLCVDVQLRTDGTVASAVLAFSDRAPAARPGQPGRTQTGGAIRLVPGSGMLARTPTTANNQDAPLFLVTDLGVKYPLASTEAATALGYAQPDNQSTTVPNTLLGLLPTGPLLDPKAAAQEQPLPK